MEEFFYYKNSQNWSEYETQIQILISIHIKLD